MGPHLLLMQQSHSKENNNYLYHPQTAINMSASTIRKALGFVIIMVILLRGKAVISLVEAHTWLGVLLFICAMAYVLWGMFLQGDNA